MSEHIAAELLAQMAEGSLSQAERAPLLAHLNSCEQCYEIMMNTARFLEEEEETQQQPLEKPKVQPSSWRKFTYPLLAAAALILVVLFSSREALDTIQVYEQLAVEVAKEPGNPLMRFRLPQPVPESIIAGRVNIRNQGSPKPFDGPTYQNLRRALEGNSGREQNLQLISCHLLAAQYQQAWLAAGDAVTRWPNDLEFQAMREVSGFALFKQQGNPREANKALNALISLAIKHPTSLDLQFNAARAAQEMSDPRADELINNYLNLQAVGIHAEDLKKGRE